MSPWGWWVDATRKINEARRLIGESLDCRMDVFPDDDLMDVANAVQDDDPCDNPNVHSLAGCESCIDALVIICALAFDRTLADLWRREGVA